jgi:hypothetical protein
MTQLVTLEEVKQGLRVDSNDDNNLLTLLIGAASNAVINYLKSQAAELFDLETAQNNSPQDANVPDEVKQATILLVDYYYRGDYENADPGYLPPPVMALLYPLRDPAIA